MWNSPSSSAASAAALACALCAALHGQPVAAADAKPDPAEAAAAMERAKRLAANPLRVILEASKVKRKVVAEPEPPGSPQPAPVAVATGATSPVTLVSPATASALPAARVDEVPPPAPRPPPPQVRTLHASAIGSGAGAAPAQGLAAIDRPELSLSVPAASTPSLRTEAPAASAVPQLIEMVEPTFPQRAFEEVGRGVEIAVDLTIRPDGSVASAVVQQPAPRQLVRYIIAACERWRFAPLPAQQVHRVQLVFNGQ